MSQRITPLTRNQLLELEALVRNLIHAVTQPAQPSTPTSLHDQSWPSSATSTPTSLPVSGTDAKACTSESNALGRSSATSIEGISSSSSSAYAQVPRLWQEAPPSLTKSSNDPISSFFPSEPAATAIAPVDHAVLHGAFIDVFREPMTASAWRMYDKMLYLVWWSYRPPSCGSCGMQDAWMPSGDVEYKCAFCLTGAGTTRTNTVIEETETTNAGKDDSTDEDEDEGGGGRVAGNPTSGDGAFGYGSSGGGGGPIDAYVFFYEWLQRIPVLGPAGSSSTSAVALSVGHGEAAAVVVEPQRRVGSSDASTAAFTCPFGDESKRAPHASLSSAGRHTGFCPATATVPPVTNSSAVPKALVAVAAMESVSSSVFIPTGEALPMVLRAAYDMANLLITPGLPRGTAPSIRAAALYLSLLLHRFVSLFPLFCLAGRAAMKERAAVLQPPARAPTGLVVPATPALQQRVDVDLQWVDVELLGALLGVTAPSFFESAEVSLQHLQNFFTVAAAYGVPSILWHPGRVPGRVEAIRALKEKVIPLCPVSSAVTSGVSGLSPEHTAVVVALELARRVDAQPIAAASTSPAAAAQSARRIGMWLDALGLYPTRSVYCESPVSRSERTSAVEGPADGVGNEIGADVAAWERTLTHLSASNDPQLHAATERHAHRHAGDATNAPSAVSYLTTTRSPFHQRFEWILSSSPCANALLHIFAAVLRVTPMELADLALRSGIYAGSARGFTTTLRTAMLCGDYDVMPLTRRLSPWTSSWVSVYMALHSDDRLPLLAVLSKLQQVENTARDRQVALARLLQRILRKHQAQQLYQFNFVLRVTDEEEKHFKGLYCLSSVLWDKGLATFTCLRSGRKTITLNRHSRRLVLCYLNTKEKSVKHLQMQPAPPVVAAVETDAARLVMEVALGSNTAAAGDPWRAVVRCLDKCARVRRRMRVPMLASRLDALASIREHSQTLVRQFQQFCSFLGGGAGARLGPTLLGWGETEVLLAAAPPFDVQQLRRDLQWNYLSLPHVSLLFGLSENRVVALYALLVGVLELLHARLGDPTSSVPDAGSVVTDTNWVEELLYVDDNEEDDEVGVESGWGSGGASVMMGWSPATYRNSRPGTPKQSRSPPSKFGAVSASTNASLAAGKPTMSRQPWSYGAGGPQGHSPPLARAPYTMTPPSMGPTRSPVLRSAHGGYSTTTAAAAPSSHNAVATPTLPYGTPPLGGSAAGLTPGKRRGSGDRDSALDGAPLSLPYLQLAESTADVAERLARGGSPGMRGQRRHARRDDDADGGDCGVRKRRSRRVRSSEGEEDDVGGWQEGAVHGDKAAEEERQEQAREATREADLAARRCAEVMQLLRQTLPSYWEVLLGLQTNFADRFASLTKAGPGVKRHRRREGEEENDDDDMELFSRGRSSRPQLTGTTTAAPQDRRFREGDTSAAVGPPRRHRRVEKEGEGERRGTPTVGGGATVSNSEATIAHKSFNVFDTEECRRRLHRLYVFIDTYERQKATLMALAVQLQGELPRMITSPAAPSQRPHSTDTSVLASQQSLPVGNGTSTPVRLSPPPPLRTPPSRQLTGPATAKSKANRSPPQRPSGSPPGGVANATPAPFRSPPLGPAVLPQRGGAENGTSPSSYRIAGRLRSPNGPRLLSSPPARPSTPTEGPPTTRCAKPLREKGLFSSKRPSDSGVMAEEEDGETEFSLPPSEVAWATSSASMAVATSAKSQRSSPRVSGEAGATRECQQQIVSSRKRERQPRATADTGREASGSSSGRSSEAESEGEVVGVRTAMSNEIINDEQRHTELTGHRKMKMTGRRRRRLQERHSRLQQRRQLAEAVRRSPSCSSSHPSSREVSQSPVLPPRPAMPTTHQEASPGSAAVASVAVPSIRSRVRRAGGELADSGDINRPAPSSPPIAPLPPPESPAPFEGRRSSSGRHHRTSSSSLPSSTPADVSVASAHHSNSD